MIPIITGVARQDIETGACPALASGRDSPVAEPPCRFREGFGSIARWWRLLAGGSRQPATERDHVRNFIDFLEDRRVLYTPYFLEYPAHVVASVQQIDTAANTALSVISPTSKASGPIRRVRRACSVFLDRPEIMHARNSGAAILAVSFFSQSSPCANPGDRGRHPRRRL